jgi:hypothetical protein
MKKPSKPTTTGGSTGGGFSEILGNPMNSIGQETSEIPDPLIYGYQRGGQVPMTPGNMFRRRMAIMRGGMPGYQRGGQVNDGTGGGRPAWAGQPTQQPTAGIPAGTLPPGLQGTLPPGLANMSALPKGLSNYAQNQGQPDQSNTAAAQGYARGGNVLSSGQRKRLPSSSFAIPSKKPGSGSYPIPDASHARNALARSSGKPVAAAVRAKVHSKFPNIGKK